MTKVINDPDGTGKIAKIDGMTLAGKTGTAELKVSKEAEGKELGWFAAFDLNSPDMVITMMIEDVKVEAEVIFQLKSKTCISKIICNRRLSL